MQLNKDDFAVLFDMDGTLINNTPYHFLSWQRLYRKYGIGELSKAEYYTTISGVPVLETIRRVFGNGRTEAELQGLLEEKESYYRSIYAPHLRGIKGIEDFLARLKATGIKMALGTSATPQDIDFIFKHLLIKQYFDAIINTSMVTRPKPDPQVYLLAAEALNMPTNRCIVFEDSLAGIKSAHAAGMKVVGITTGHTAAELQPVDLVIDDYEGLTADKIKSLFQGC